MSKDTGGAAFPLATGWVEERHDGSVKTTVLVRELDRGMPLRDYFAAKAMPAHLQVLGACDFSGPEECAAEVAKLSYILADAMLFERSKP